MSVAIAGPDGRLRQLRELHDRIVGLAVKARVAKPAAGRRELDGALAEFTAAVLCAEGRCDECTAGCPFDLELDDELDDLD